MTNEQAIEVLEMVEAHGLADEAKKMAIQALQTEPYFWEKCPYYEPDIMFDGKEEYDYGQCKYKSSVSDPLEVESAKEQKAYNKGFEDCRQAAIDAVRGSIWAQNHIKNLPSVQPAQRVGHWVITDYEYYDCSVCGESYYNGCESRKEAEERLKMRPYDVYSFCPHCGAKME